MDGETRRSSGLLIGLVRYGIGAAMVIAGIVLAAINPSGLGVDGFAMAAGGGLSVLLINLLFRLSVTSNLERDREEEARRYLDEHGAWSEEESAAGRRWHIPAGSVTAEEERQPPA